MHPARTFARSARTSGALIAALVVLSGCHRSRDSHIRGGLESQRLALCGWLPPPTERFAVRSFTMQIAGDDARGTGTFAATLAAASGYQCQGTGSFSYTRSIDNLRMVHYMLRDVHRTGAPAPIVAVVERRAIPAVLGTSSEVSLQAWPELPGVNAAASRFEIPTAGRYRFVFPQPASERTEALRRWFVAYQNGAAVRDRFGGISEIELSAGPVFILAMGAVPGPAVLTTGVALYGARPAL